MMASLAAWLGLVRGFENNQSPLRPVGSGALHIEHEFALLFWITGTVHCVVLLVLVVSVARQRNTLDTMLSPCRPRLQSISALRMPSRAR